jgi:hypothetical protein
VPWAHPNAPACDEVHDIPAVVPQQDAGELRVPLLGGGDGAEISAAAQSADGSDGTAGPRGSSAAGDLEQGLLLVDEGETGSQGGASAGGGSAAGAGGAAAGGGTSTSTSLLLEEQRAVDEVRMCYIMRYSVHV